MKTNQHIAVYDRTSTKAQRDGSYQSSDYKKQGYRMFFDHGVSGAVAFDKRFQGRKLQKAIDSKEITKVIIPKLDRLGRNTADILKTLEVWHEKKLTIEVQSPGMCNFNDDGTENICWQLIVPLMSAVAQIERKSIAERMAEGRKRAIANGKAMGRKHGSVDSRDKFLNKIKTKNIIDLLKTQFPKTEEFPKGYYPYKEIAKRLGVSVYTITKVAKYIVDDLAFRKPEKVVSIS